MPPLDDVHLERPEEIEPGLLVNVHGLPINDPMAQMPLIDLSSLQPVATQPGCTLICISSAPAPAG
ncbi:hypothetical protein MUBE_02925 [Mycobacterium uberis]|uniref:Uncharacterized protein n=1 Tax=Mycobacterium uberis TaxID=2162698 RepID=A0A3E1HK02_9MYCO|nr:hypothetical protein MUBE_02925 [Mycobacterium uberis]